MSDDLELYLQQIAEATDRLIACLNAWHERYDLMPDEDAEAITRARILTGPDARRAAPKAREQSR